MTRAMTLVAFAAGSGLLALEAVRSVETTFATSGPVSVLYGLYAGVAGLAAFVCGVQFYRGLPK
jgi:hypothetical protein